MLKYTRSAFEAFITDTLYRKMLKEVTKIIDLETDSVRVYRLLDGSEVELIGRNIKIEDKDVIVV